jgi:hypothetical protein
MRLDWCWPILSFKLILRPIIGQILDPSNCKFLIYKTLSNLILKKHNLKTTEGKYQQQKINIQPKNNTQKFKCTNGGCRKTNYVLNLLPITKSKLDIEKVSLANNSCLQNRSSQIP